MPLNRIKKEARRKQVGKTGELLPGMSKKFILTNGKHRVEGMLLNYHGSLYAYLNRCPHIGLSLDWVDNEFFSVDGRYLVCANHGATFEPATGECVWGPCAGASLQSVPVELEGEQVFVRSTHWEDQDGKF